MKTNPEQTVNKLQDQMSKIKDNKVQKFVKKECLECKNEINCLPGNAPICDACFDKKRGIKT